MRQGLCSPSLLEHSLLKTRLAFPTPECVYNRNSCSSRFVMASSCSWCTSSHRCFLPSALSQLAWALLTTHFLNASSSQPYSFHYLLIRQRLIPLLPPSKNQSSSHLIRLCQNRSFHHSLPATLWAELRSSHSSARFTSLAAPSVFPHVLGIEEPAILPSGGPALLHIY